MTAHAYLFYPDGDELTPEARARLATLADHTELGAGLRRSRCATSRSAAPATCSAPSSRATSRPWASSSTWSCSREAVAELAGTRRPVARPIRVEAQVDAYVPAAYVSAEAQKIDLHRRLALAETEDELRELRAAIEDRFGPPPEPVENLFAIQEAKLKLARLGGDYLVFRGGKATVGPLVLGSDELRELRRAADIAVYSSAKKEVSQRGDGIGAALALVDAILDIRLAA